MTAATSYGNDSAAGSGDSSTAAQSAADESQQGGGNAGGKAGGAKASPLDGVESQFSELLAYLAHYFAAQRDLFQWRLLAVFWRVVLLLGVGLAMLSVLVTAAVLVLLGAVHGLGAALGDRMWAGELIVGSAVFIILAISQSMAFQRFKQGWRERIRAKYEFYRARERAAFGRDVERSTERAADARPSGEPIDPLQHEADLARAAIGQKFQELKASLQTAADPREWAREHPWIAVSVAAAAGFATALAITAPRSKARGESSYSSPEREHERERERAYNGDDGYAPRRDAYAPHPSPGIGGSIVSMLFELAKIFMTSHLVPLFQAWQQGLAEQAAQAARGQQPEQASPADGASSAGDAGDQA